MQLESFVIQDNKTKDYIAIDESSGGYVCLIPNKFKAKRFFSQISVEVFLHGDGDENGYAKMFPDECSDVTVVKMD